MASIFVQMFEWLLCILMGVFIRTRVGLKVAFLFKVICLK